MPNWKKIITSGSDAALQSLTVSTTITANSFKTPTGTSTQFLMADGSVNSNTYSLTSHTHTFAELTSKPTTLSGYGITDAFTKTETTNLIANPTSSVNISGGLTINGSLNSGGSNFAGYRQGGDNIILNGNSTGVSGIFFQSEKDGTNINHPSDYGYIQFHAHGIDGTTGESNKLVIGVANDADDMVILQSPYKNGVKISYLNSTSGTGSTAYTVWHQGNHGAGSGLDADLLDGQDSTYFLNTSATTQTKSGNLNLTSTLTVTGSVIIANTTNPAQRNILATDVNGYLTFQNLTYANTIGSGNGNVNLTQNYPIIGNTTTSGYMFSSQTNAVAGTQDVGIRRYNVGSIEIFNGTTGDGSITNRRDLILRNITGSNALFTGDVTSSGSAIVSGTLEVDTVNNGVGDFLTRTAGGIIARRTSSEVRSDIGAIGGTGTNNYIPKFTGSTALGNSNINDNGSLITLNSNVSTNGNLIISQSLLQYSNLTSVTSGSTSNVALISTGSYTAAFFDYVATSGTNSRAGTVFTVWNGNNIEFSETSTNDIGNTSNLILSASLISGNIGLQATSLSGSWGVKTLVRMI